MFRRLQGQETGSLSPLAVRNFLGNGGGAWTGICVARCPGLLSEDRLTAAAEPKGGDPEAYSSATRLPSVMVGGGVVCSSDQL